MKYAGVLSSGGLDSSVCLAVAVDKYGAQNVTAINVFYGQRHAKEIESSKKIALHYGVRRIEVDLSQCFASCKSSLMATSNEMIDVGSYHEQLATGSLHTVVPFRNGLFLATAVCRLLGEAPDRELDILLGNHAGDVENHEYADCSAEFIDSMRSAVEFGTEGKVSLVSPFVKMQKHEIVALGAELNVPFGITWSCYNGMERPCRECATCIQRESAFSANGMVDPLLSECTDDPHK